MKITAIIQARMGSTRLPGKILKKVMNKTLLEYQLERVKRSLLIDEIVVATTKKESDNPIVALCEQLGAQVYRGSEQDVLSRYYEAAVALHADLIVRLTSDCPLIDPTIIDQVIQLHIDQEREVDYTSNALVRSFPRGLDTEVFTFDALQYAHEHAILERDREHVTAYIYSNKEKFKFAALKSIHNYESHRWTVDTEEDFELIKRILEALYPSNPQFTMQDVLNLLEENPTWPSINAHIEQKKL